MPAATPEPVRLRIWQAAQQGQDAATIAQTLTVPVRTVRHLLQQFRPAGLPCPPRFENSGRRPDSAFAALRSQALRLRYQHPRWGAERILSRLFPGGHGPGRPDPGTVRRWLAQAGLAPATNLSAENIRALQVGRRPGRSAERTRKRRAARAEVAPGQAEASMSALASAVGRGEGPS